MKLTSLLIFLILSSLPFDVLIANTYKVNSGDLLRVEVYGEPELAQDLNVDALGFIEYPFIGKISVMGKQLGMIKSEIVTLLKDGYFVDPQVNVAVKKFRPFFIQGEVESPGSFPFEVGMTIRKALSLAGGLTERASKKKIYVTRNIAGKEESVKVGLDYTVLAGDIIDIKESFF